MKCDTLYHLPIVDGQSWTKEEECFLDELRRLAGVP